MVYIHYSDVENPVNEPWGSSSLGLWDGHGDLQDPRDHATIMGFQTSVCSALLMVVSPL